MIIDIHGHYTTAPKALEAWRNRQVAALGSPSEQPKVAELNIGDDELHESIEHNQLRLMRERGLDLTIFSPRASFMAHHIGDFQVSSTWAAVCRGAFDFYALFRLDAFKPGKALPCVPKK
ncbi:amidohydrolase family protein [Burkholderia sp. IDO3]|uniref:amidohydrolase family protein n=1 Tax=Burkholderia sp. IDO3 TaxID=1705310 RepID=UPI001F07A96B|nr:amidohydrolase family protein [Burkholderia sp. IDO3]